MENQTRISTIKQYFRNSGIALPDDFTSALDDIETRYSVARGDGDKSADGQRAVLELVRAAAAAGRDPRTDKALRDLALSKAMDNLGIGRILTDLREEELGVVFREHAESLLGALQDPFDSAAEVIETARQHLGPTVNLDSAAAAHVQPSNTAKWGGAYAAVSQISMIVQLWEMITSWAGLVTRGRNELRVLITADVDPEMFGELAHQWPLWPEFDDGTLDGRPYDAMLPVHRGLPLSLATVDEYKRRCEALNAYLSGVKAHTNALNKHVGTARRALAQSHIDQTNAAARGAVRIR